MGLYDGIKDVANIIQKADNIELYGKLLDLSAQALELQNDVARLTEENNKLKQKENISNNIVRHDETYITLKNDKYETKYCSCCWDSSGKMVQVRTYDDGEYMCHLCKNKGYYDKEKYRTSLEECENNV